VDPALPRRPARAGARRIGLPEDASRLAALIPDDDLASFAAGLVRISLLPRRVEPLATDQAGAAPAEAVVE
jgi:hypothetical protein